LLPQLRNRYRKSYRGDNWLVAADSPQGRGRL